MRVAVLHRYPFNQIVGTNASFPSFINELEKSGHQIYYLTYRDKQGEKVSGVSYRELPFFFNRGNRKDKLIKTLLWTFLVPFLARQVKKNDQVELFYCDDSVPYYGFLTKLLVGKAKVVIRLGDLQSGYNFADQGAFKNFLFKYNN